MVDRYFVRYHSLQDEGPYSLPKDLKECIDTIQDLRIILDGSVQPVFIVEASPEAIGVLESLEDVINVYRDTTFQLLEKKK